MTLVRLIKMTNRKPVQQSLPMNGWGGRRDGAGRKPGGATKVSRRPRPSHSRHHPAHVTLRLVDGLENLRKPSQLRVVREALADSKEKFGFRLNQFSIQHNHLHMVTEAQDKRALARGLQGLAIRVAKRINRRLGRRGKVFADRYHARALRTPREVRNALLYVLSNARKHAGRRPALWLDPCSSALFFDGWRPGPYLEGVLLHVDDRGPPPVAEPKSWLLRIGWRRHGLILCSERPS